MTIERTQAIRARTRCIGGLQRGHSIHHCLPKPIPLMQILYIEVRSNRSRTTLSLAGSNAGHLSLQIISNPENGARTDWKTASQSWLYAASLTTSSFASFSLNGGGMAMKRLAGALTITPSVVSNSMVKSGDSRSFFLDLSSSFFFSLAFFLSLSSSFFSPGSETSSSIGATESSSVEFADKCQFAAAPVGNVSV